MKKTNIEKFLGLKQVIEIFGIDFMMTVDQQQNLILYFDRYGYRTSQNRYSRLAWFIKQGVIDLFAKEKNLLRYPRMSVEYFRELYGVTIGEERWNSNLTKIRDCFPSREIYWSNNGYSAEEAKLKVKEHQINASLKSQNRNHKKFSIRCKEYWIEKGYTEESAVEMVSNCQRRGISFYVEKYGDVIGIKKYNASCKKRIRTWENKPYEERKNHYLKTIPTSFNESGQEMQAIKLILLQNDISANRCMFGPPSSQFYQWIPEHGFRRYDLAIFEDSTKTVLQYIIEYHGPGHINFSDYISSMDNKIIEVDGRPLPHLGTCGHSYRNDIAKKQHINSKFPDVKYCVYWVKDLKNKDLRLYE